ncbi:MAG: hypothetical protein IT454_09490 [Planctomycetes bacterium]|nr:hypothetical protein [Planctomycetota bacterium]
MQLDCSSRPRAGSAKWPLLAVLVLGSVALALAGTLPRPWSSPRAAAATEGALVRRGPLRFAVTVGGSLRATDTLRLACGVEGRTTILSIVPEGTQVANGDIVCELDATALVEKRIEQSIQVANAEAALVKATQLIEIQESQNKSDKKAARQKVEFAEQDLQMFLEGERTLELESSQQEIDLAREEAQRADGRLSWSEKLSEKGFLTATELEADRISRHRAQVELHQATQLKDMLERFRLPRRESELRAALEEAHQELERVDLQAKAHLVDLESNRRSSQAALELEREKLARLEAQIDKAKLRAPCAGYVVYARRDNDEPPIAAGAEVREREEVLSIPSSAGMTAEVKLHESVLKQVVLGQSCRITVDALRGLELVGRVAYVAVLPDQNSRWSNPNMRVYRCDVVLETDHAALRPGMSCSVEVEIEDLADALHVPVQAVFREGRSTVAFVVTPDGYERRAVRVGRFDELWVQVLDGLREGEHVRLDAPLGALAPSTGESDG